MKTKMYRNAVIASGVVAVVVLVTINVMSPPPAGVAADEPPEIIRLTGAIRDFRAAHPDFAASSGQHAHCAHGVEDVLGTDRVPEYHGGGVVVDEQWYDRVGNPIRPYDDGDELGLPGGHFDVDVFDRATTKELYHQHKYDDKYNVTYVDIAGDARLLFNDVIGPAYPNDLRVVFLNQHHGSGHFIFEAAGETITGLTRDGFEKVFDPATLQQLRIDFVNLLHLRGSKPGDVQDDFVDRDDSLSIQMYDVTTGALAYELSVYHHTSPKRNGLPGNGAGGPGGGGPGGGGAGPPATVCGVDTNDQIGTYGSDCSGAVTSPDTFAQWFSDGLGTNLSTSHTITLTRDANGVYEYLTDDFYPIDARLFGNEGIDHNELFTYAITATFTFEECEALFFEFQGNDDAWVYIDDQLVIDLGGLNPGFRQYIELDRMNLVDGESYTLAFFYAHRRNALDSVFRMRTNIVLRTSGSVPVTGGYD